MKTKALPVAAIWHSLGSVYIASEAIATRTQVVLGVGGKQLDHKMVEVRLYPRAKPRIYALGEDTADTQRWVGAVDKRVRALTAERYGFYDLCGAAGRHALGDEVSALQALLALRVVDGAGGRTPRRRPRLTLIPTES